MRRKSFSFGEVLGFGWRAMKDNLGFFVAVFIILFLISSLGQIFGYVVQQYSGIISSLFGLLLPLVTLIIGIIVAIGFIKITLSLCDERKPKFSMLFDAWGYFWKYLVTGLLYGLIIMGPPAACMVLVIFPSAAMSIPYFMPPLFIMGFILAVTLVIKFSLCFYFVVDKGLGPINALKASSRTTMGAKWSLFVFGILCSLINLLGVLCFGIGTFATLLIIMIAMALVYRQLSAQTPALNEFGISSPVIQPSLAVQSGLSIRLRPDPAVQPVLGVQPVPRNQPDSGIPSAPRAQPASGNQPHTGVQHVLGNQPGAGMQSDSDIQSVPRVRPISVKKKSNSLLLVVLLALAVVIVGGTVYYLRPATTKAEPSNKDVALTGILYTEGNSSAVVDGKIVHEQETMNGVKVIKIHEDKVEFERAGERWTQQVK
jgi:hypothetical protein